MARTKQINPSPFKAQKSLQTMKDSDGTLWIETKPGNWELYVVWKERMDTMKDNLEKSFNSMKRKELQSLAKSRGISTNKKSCEIIESLICYSLPENYSSISSKI